MQKGPRICGLLVAMGTALTVGVPIIVVLSGLCLFSYVPAPTGLWSSEDAMNNDMRFKLTPAVDFLACRRGRAGTVFRCVVCRGCPHSVMVYPQVSPQYTAKYAVLAPAAERGAHTLRAVAKRSSVALVHLMPACVLVVSRLRWQRRRWGGPRSGCRN